MSFHCIFNSYYATHQYNAGHWNVKYQWEIITKQHAFQGDSSSCGVYVMKVCQFGYKFVICGNMLTYTIQFGEYYISKKDSNMLTAAIDVPACREEMAIKLLINSSKLCCYVLD